MNSRGFGIVWLAVAVGAGAMLRVLPLPLAALPAGFVVVFGASGGPSAVAGLGAAVLAGWAGSGQRGAESNPCLPEGRVVLRGYATELPEGPRGSVAFRTTHIADQPCASDGVVFGHGGRLVPGAALTLFGRVERTGSRAAVIVMDSANTLTTAQHAGRLGDRLGATLVRLRVGYERRVTRALPPDAAPLAVALTAGRRRSVPASVRDDFSRSGTAHLLAVSGFHVGVIGGLLALAAAIGGAGPRRRSVASLLLVWVYVAMIGTPASGVRAAGLLTVMAVGRVLGRPTRRLPGLAAVFLVCLVVRPLWLSGIGFQLSFAASFGLFVSTGWPDRVWGATGRLLGRVACPPTVLRVLEPLVRGAVVATGATLPTIPFVAWHFGSVSLVSVPATLTAMPLAAASIVAVLVTAGVGMVWASGALVLGGATSELLGLLETVVHAWASPSFAAVAVSGPAAATLGTALILTPLLLPRTARARALSLSAAFSVVASLLIVDGWQNTASRQSVELIFIDVGQGDAILIRSPANRWALVDAGPASSSGWDAGARRVVPLLRRRGVSRLETLVLTHADADHVGGAAAVLRNVEVGSVVDPGRVRGSRPFLNALTVAQSRGVPWRPGGRGTVWSMDGVEFTVLSPLPGRRPSTANDDSIVLLVRFGEFEALLTGDAGSEVERRILVDLPQDLEVLKAGHHGSSTSTSRALLDSTSPDLAVISVGQRNRYGHPDPGVLGRIQHQGARILRTDQHGTVRVRAFRTGRTAVDVARK